MDSLGVVVQLRLTASLSSMQVAEVPIIVLAVPAKYPPLSLDRQLGWV
jgi:hypothetical protein